MHILRVILILVLLSMNIIQVVISYGLMYNFFMKVFAFILWNLTIVILFAIIIYLIFLIDPSFGSLTSSILIVVLVFAIFYLQSKEITV